MENKSPTTDPIDSFKTWALKLGCPVNSLPSDAALNRFIKSNHANVKKLVNRVRSKSEVKLFRDNILLQSLRKSDLLSDRQNDLPNEYKNLRKVEKLNCQIGELKPRVEQLKIELNDKKSNLSEKALQLREVSEHHRSIQNKYIQLKQKHVQLVANIDEETKFEALLADGMPVQVTTVGADDKIAAEKAIKKSLDIVKIAYDEIGDRGCTDVHRAKIEREMRKAMAGIPVVQLFDALKCYNMNEMNAVNEKLNAINVHPSEGPASSAFEVAVTKSLMKLYIAHLTTNKLKEQHGHRVEQYVQLYDQYLANIVDEMRSFNGPDAELFADSICGDYLKQYGTFISNQSVLQLHREKLSNLQQLATERDNLLRGNELTAAELTAIYATIEQTYNSTLDDIVSLDDVSKSTKQLQALSKYTINSFGNKSICNTSASLLNSSIGQLGTSMTINLASPEYVKELSMLVDVAHEKWNQVPLQLSMDIECHRTNEVFSQFYSILTPNATLKNLQSKWAWYGKIDALTQPLDVDKFIPQFTDSELVSSKLATETTKMSKLMEDIRFMYETGSKTEAEIRKYLAFLLDHSLGSFIPDRVMINRRTFQDYEEEFLCACSLISNSMKKN